jgi:hypothetical protein
MSMSTHVVGFKPPDETWKKMKAVWDACTEAGIEAPEEVRGFFPGEEPTDSGVEVDQEDLIYAGAIEKWSANWREGFEIIVEKIPPDVKIIRVYNAW